VKRWYFSLAALALASSSCKPSAPPPSVDAATSSSASPAASAAPVAQRDERVRRIWSAEYRRSSREIEAADLADRDVTVRRLAARALARIADTAAREPLNKLLADEDPEVVAWAAYGLGYVCKGHEAATVRALVSRAASWAASPPVRNAGLELDATLADALGRCGDAEAEATLRAWLDVEERAEAAALALGRMASRKKRLDDASVVALLDAASRPEKPVESALFAFSRLPAGSDALRSRLLEVASDALAGPASPRRSFAVRALERAGEPAVPALARVAGDAGFSIPERVDALRALGRLGEPGRSAVEKALAALEPKPESLTNLSGAEFAPLSTALDALPSASKQARPLLERFAKLEAPKDAPALARRVVSLRCRAATLLAGDAITFALLTSCDPEPNGEAGQLALVEVLDKGKLEGTRGKRWRALVEGKSPLVRQAALELLKSHPEVDQPAPLLAKALRAPDAGTVITAAQVIATYPDRAAENRPKKREAEKSDVKDPNPGLTEPSTPEPTKPHPAVVDALTSAFALSRPPDATEAFSALVDAAGALQVLSFKSKLDAFCKGDQPTLREHAEKALRLMGDQKRSCAEAGPGKPPPELDRLVKQKTRLVFETDAGEAALTLDPELAPLAVTRFVELARAGFFEKVKVHRVVPGFVAQLGDPGGDGYGGAGREPLRCETSPLTFSALSVGVALAGRDTGSSQLFVTLAAFPHLDGDYALIGRAEPGWEKIARGDEIRKVRVEGK